MSGPLLEGVDVAKRFGGLRVLSGVGFAVAAREIVALVGPNGAGKTTLFNLISGLDHPSSGVIRLEQETISRLPAHRIARRGVGRTFQTPRPFADLTPLDNVRAASRFGQRPGPEPMALLDLVGLAAQARDPTRRLSSAWRKLLELAMALAQSPKVVLLDEPLAGLAPAEVVRATVILRRIRDEHGVTLFWIEHNMRAVMATADRVIVLHHGEVIHAGEPASVARDARVLAAYLGQRRASV
jgi:ABC-type branched-subunit amino acid transport system ATPase component